MRWAISGCSLAQAVGEGLRLGAIPEGGVVDLGCRIHGFTPDCRSVGPFGSGHLPAVEDHPTEEVHPMSHNARGASEPTRDLPTGTRCDEPGSPSH